MGLIECPDCKGKVSEIAPSCPHCGRPFNHPAPTADQGIPTSNEPLPKDFKSLQAEAEKGNAEAQEELRRFSSWRERRHGTEDDDQINHPTPTSDVWHDEPDPPSTSGMGKLAWMPTGGALLWLVPVVIILIGIFSGCPDRLTCPHCGKGPPLVGNRYGQLADSLGLIDRSEWLDQHLPICPQSPKNQIGPVPLRPWNPPDDENNDKADADD